MRKVLFATLVIGVYSQAAIAFDKNKFLVRAGEIIKSQDPIYLLGSMANETGKAKTIFIATIKGSWYRSECQQLDEGPWMCSMICLGCGTFSPSWFTYVEN